MLPKCFLTDAPLDQEYKCNNHSSYLNTHSWVTLNTFSAKDIANQIMETIARTFECLVVIAVILCIIVTAQDNATEPIDGADEICRNSSEWIWIADKESICW